MSDELDKIVDRLLSVRCVVSEHDGYDGPFCSECGHDARTEIRAALELRYITELRRLRELIVAFSNAADPQDGEDDAAICAFCFSPYSPDAHAPYCPWPALKAEACAIREESTKA
jgi:hypothetical protein